MSNVDTLDISSKKRTKVMGYFLLYTIIIENPTYSYKKQNHKFHELHTYWGHH